MKATETNLLNFLKQPNQFTIPIYQRTYSWTLKQCQQLWEDIVRVAQDEEISGHFVGSIVYIEAGLYQVASIPQLLVIDGQQRLTTISLLLSALGKAISGGEEKVEITQRKIENYFLFNNEEEGEYRYKLLLTQSDRQTFINIIENRDLPKNASQRLRENYLYFESQIRKRQIDLNGLYNGIGKLLIVNIALDRDRDNPQLIFESLNSTGLDLSQADLIRNYVLMGLPTKEQEKVYEKYWYPMEETFDKANQMSQFDRFIRDYLTLKSKSGAIPKVNDVYNSFKAYIEKLKGKSIVELIAEVYAYSKHYARLAFQEESDPEIRQALEDINTVKVDVAYPFLLEVYDDFSQNLLTKDELIKILRLVESYVFRRAICGIPTNSMNKTFATLSREIDRDNYLESVQLAFIRKEGYKRFPDDREFEREFVVKDIYNFRNRLYLLCKLENYHRPKELVDVDNYTIEHILPQNPKLSPEWKADLGNNWQEIQAKYLHTIGNLTLTAYNREYGDRPFSEKREMEGGFKVSPLYLNQRLGKLEKWDETEIQKRAAELASWAVKIWDYPAIKSPDAEINVQAILTEIFSNPTELSRAKGYVQEVVDLIGYDKIEHILAMTYRQDRGISINVGQWAVLRFIRQKKALKGLFAIDSNYPLACDGIKAEVIDSFAPKWTGEQEIELVQIDLKNQQLSESFLEAWKVAIRQAYQAFKTWSSSSYMNYHLPELAEALVQETARSRHAEYLQGKIGELFETLRKRILNLDPSVREEFKKFYIAYKTTTNFVDIVPQRSRLRLLLNLKFSQIQDPKGICRDVSEIGRWGNGEVEVGLSSPEELEDIMHLICQAFHQHNDDSEPHELRAS